MDCCIYFRLIALYLSGSIPSVVDAVFETISGFTTTGATIIENIELIPKGIVFWRSFIHWIGGMGILVFTVAILPTLGVGGFQIYKAEIPGPVADKIVPRIKDTAKILYRTFIIFTIIETLLLMMGGMSFYESIIHAFGTIGTGGCSTNKMSIGAYDSTYIHVVVSLFMMFSGICFSNYYSLSKGKWREVLKDEEIRLYFKIILLSTVLIGINLYFTTDKGFGISLRDSFFQTTSIISTTGYSTVDFDKWSAFNKAILLLLMFFGGCSGSTSGGIKIIRILTLLKLVKREIVKIFHPRAMIPLKIGDKTVASDTTASITSFFMLYIAIFFWGL